MTVELHLGDCLEYVRTMPDKSVDAIITDLPYGTTACSWDVIIPFEPMWEQVKRINKGVFVTTASQPFTSKLIMSNLDWFKYEWIWEKGRGSNYLQANKQPLKYHENILVFYEHQCTYNPQKTKGELYKKIVRCNNKTDSAFGKDTRDIGYSYSSDERYPQSIISINTSIGINTIHPTQKPVALYEYLVLTYTNEGATVLDITCGSGTTGVACVNTNRNCILVDNKPEYIEIARKRISDAQQQMRLGI